MLEKQLLAAADTATKVEPMKEAVEEQVTLSVYYFDKLKDYFLSNGFDFIIAAIIFAIGYMIAKLVRSIVKWTLESNRWKSSPNYDPTVVLFVEQLIYYGILFMTVIAALQRIGVPQSTFVAAVGGMGLAVGLALQSDLANFAAGLIILIFKPFRVGDWIQLAGSADVVGAVERIGLSSTIIKNREGRTLYVPNGNMTKATIINSSAAPERFFRFDVGITYDNDHHAVIELLRGIFNDSPHVTNKETLEIGITSLDAAVTISAFPKVPISEGTAFSYWVMSEIKDRFAAAKVNRPGASTVNLNYPAEGVTIKLAKSDIDYLQDVVNRDR